MPDPAPKLAPISVAELAEIIKVFSPLFRKDKPTTATPVDATVGTDGLIETQREVLATTASSR